MNENMTVQWFPGHMAKTRRLIKENLAAVDAVCEIVDARIPESSRNPELDEIIGAKPRIVLLNKCDLADEKATARKMKELEEKGIKKEYETALLWLTDCGLVHQLRRVSKPNLPLKAYEDMKAFKLFVSDE